MWFNVLFKIIRLDRITLEALCLKRRIDDNSLTPDSGLGIRGCPIIVVAIVVVVMQGGRRGTSKLSDGSLARGNTIEYETSAST